MPPTVTQERYVPSLRQLRLDPTPQPLDIPLDIDIVLHDQRTFVPISNRLLQRPRLPPERADDRFVDLPDPFPFPTIPQRFGDVEIGIGGGESRVVSSGVVGFEMGDPVAGGVASIGREGGEGVEAGFVEGGSDPVAADG
jgi:hypothetical protein